MFRAEMNKRWALQWSLENSDTELHKWVPDLRLLPSFFPPNKALVTLLTGHGRFHPYSHRFNQMGENPGVSVEPSIEQKWKNVGKGSGAENGSNAGRGAPHVDKVRGCASESAVQEKPKQKYTITRNHTGEVGGKALTTHARLERHLATHAEKKPHTSPWDRAAEAFPVLLLSFPLHWNRLLPGSPARQCVCPLFVLGAPGLSDPLSQTVSQDSPDSSSDDSVSVCTAVRLGAATRSPFKKS
ncbi:hypothetical protein MRX96_044104 [Rhipicephalus microplus]